MMSDLQLRLKHSKGDAEDWTKTDDKALRKTIQNRLAQRKRRTKVAKGKAVKGAELPRERQASQDEHQDQSLAPSADISSGAPPQSVQTLPQGYRGRYTLYVQNTLASPALLDHRYICLTQYSLLRAFVQNALLLSLDPYLMIEDDYLSPWTITNPYPSPSGESCPHTLTPTPIQLQTFHHPFLDIIASPALRDNLLIASLDDDQEEQLCYDLHNDVSFTIWGSQPWNPMGWEVAQGFVDKWGWILDDETVKYSNFWRGERGEGPLDLSKRVLGFI